MWLIAHNGKPSQQSHPKWEVTPESHVLRHHVTEPCAKAPCDPGRQTFLGDSPFGDSLKHGRHSWDGSEVISSLRKLIQTDKRRSESEREEGWGMCITILLGRHGQGTIVSVLLEPLYAWQSAWKLSCWGWIPLWPDPFHVPLILTWESSCGRHPNCF